MGRPSVPRPYSHRKYHWEEWFAQKRVVLTRGEHYQCSQSSMAQIIRNSASAHGLRVTLEDTGTGIVVEVVGRVAEPYVEIPHTDPNPVTR